MKSIAFVRRTLRIPRDPCLPSRNVRTKHTNDRIARSCKQIFHTVHSSFSPYTALSTVGSTGYRLIRPVLTPYSHFFIRQSVMTSRAVFYSLRSIRFGRLLLNGRRWRFKDTLAFYSGSLYRPRKNIQSNMSNTAVSKPVLIDRSNDPSTFYCSHSVVELETEFNLDISTQGTLQNITNVQLLSLISSLKEDVMKAMKYLIYRHYKPLKKEVIELSLVLCDDQHIQDLNNQHLSVDSPTDVLSFPLDGVGAQDNHFEDDFPILMLGDIVLSLERANEQAKVMGHDLIVECRLLIVHGLLHLLGYDHETNDQDWKEMAEVEAATLKDLEWKGKGLIADLSRLLVLGEKDALPSISKIKDTERVKSGNFFASGISISSTSSSSSALKKSAEPSESSALIKSSLSQKLQLIALDMDGTLLTSDQRITKPTKEAIQETLSRGIQVVVATGKARPGVIRACEKYGLYGPGNLVSNQSAGIFLQGLAVYSTNGEPVEGPSLSREVVKLVFEYCSKLGISCVAFTGDETVTLSLTSDVIELHERYYEPLAKQVPSLDILLEGKPVKKLVLLADDHMIKTEIQPQLDESLWKVGSRSVISFAGMLEVVPQGVNKWTALSSLMGSLNLPADSCIAIGDGINDYEMVKNASIGVAMGNAVEAVKSVADLVVASNDDDGVAEALDLLILS